MPLPSEYKKSTVFCKESRPALVLPPHPEWRRLSGPFNGRSNAVAGR